MATDILTKFITVLFTFSFVHSTLPIGAEELSPSNITSCLSLFSGDTNSSLSLVKTLYQNLFTANATVSLFSVMVNLQLMLQYRACNCTQDCPQSVCDSDCTSLDCMELSVCVAQNDCTRSTLGCEVYDCGQLATCVQQNNCCPKKKCCNCCRCRCDSRSCESYSCEC